ncbi:excinuclease ABC subunit UvrC [Nakamurella deserti]|uniref:excinuclease ABC subunit UvrC n=1 Tax=Nakamurella deserti TaxID=2164074 RepID=UPI000DBE3B12|nr:excinuclease ABC subunit UvrC [Nakamurella deserti]
MPDPSSFRPAPGTIPDAPGVYRWRDKDGRVIYVGKAKSLRQRLNSYFADIGGLHPRTASMVTSAASVEWTVVGTEVEALQLEYNWIKEFDPRFNVRYRDDKSYPELAVTLNEEFPRFQVMRGPHRKGVRYFGPYAHAWAIRETLDLLLRVFPARTCSTGVFKRAQQIDRPCLLGYIGKCSAPCVGRVTAEEHRDIVEDFCDFLAGRAEPMVKRMEREMRAASDELDFERAARLRDDLSALRRALEKQSVVLANGTDADLIGIVGDDLEASVQIFHVRGGRMRGQRGWIVDVDVDNGPDGTAASSLSVQVENFLVQYYGNRANETQPEAPVRGARLSPRSARSREEYAPDMSPVPREILVPALPPDPEQMSDWLSGLRGSRVSLRIPQRGDKKDLAETAARNAKDALARHRLKRASDITSRSAALTELADALGMDNSPLRIECIDISHVQGTNVVASLVVFEDGLSKRSDYRRFAIRDAPGDDVASIAEVVRRRFSRQAKEEQSAEVDGPALPPGIDPETGRVRRFAYPPQLLVVDGGQPQVNAAAAAMTELGIVDVTVVGLAKRLEEVWLPGDDEPVILPRASEALYLLQRLRDEAHRFAITYHREKRSKAMTVSALDDVPGLGATRRTALLKHFGSVARLKAAGVDDLTAVPGIGATTAAAIVAALSGAPAPDPAAPATPGVRSVTVRRDNGPAMAGAVDANGREE